MKLYSYFCDAGQDFTFHVVAYADMKRVGGLQRHLADIELILKMAYPRPLGIASLVYEFASQRVGLLPEKDVAGIVGLAEDGLFYNKRQSCEWIDRIDAQPQVDDIVAARDGRLGNAEDKSVVLLPSGQWDVLVMVIDLIAYASTQQQRGCEQHQ